jgi:hypothetical protein
MSQQQQPQSRGASDPAAPALTNREEFVEKVTETGINEDTAKAVHNLLEDEGVLGNIRSADREFARLHAENVVKFVEAMHPPAESHCQGVLRQAYLGDLTDHREPLDDGTLANFRAILLAAFFRYSRSIDGWQQDKFGEQIQTKRIEDKREEEPGLIGGLFS